MGEQLQFDFQGYLAEILALLKEKNAVEDLRSDKVTEILRSLLRIVKEGSKTQSKRALSYIDKINDRAMGPK